jgi:hypothetical protein
MALNMYLTLLGQRGENLSKTAESAHATGRAGQALGRIHAIVKHVGTPMAAASLR